MPSRQGVWQMNIPKKQLDGLKSEPTQLQSRAQRQTDHGGESESGAHQANVESDEPPEIIGLLGR